MPRESARPQGEYDPPKDGFVHYDDWAGMRKVRVRILGETPKRYRVLFQEDGSRRHRKGATHLVPKYAVTQAGEAGEAGSEHQAAAEDKGRGPH